MQHLSLQRFFNKHDYNFQDASKTAFSRASWSKDISKYRLWRHIFWLWQSFINNSNCIEEVINFMMDLTWIAAIFEGWSWFKFDNFGLALVTALKFYTSVAKGLNLKVRMFCRLIPMFVEVTGEKLVRGVFFPFPSRIRLIFHLSIVSVRSNIIWSLEILCSIGRNINKKKTENGKSLFCT